MLNPFSCPTLEGTSDPVTLRDPVFISDLHLSMNEPDTLEGFLAFLENVACTHAELVILGDFFDYWVGDDASFTMTPVVNALKDISAAHPIYLMHGNRDFMMGNRFAREIGATLLKDPSVLIINGVRVLVAHGDAWCTRDHDYQNVRKRVRSVWWQWLMMRLPLKNRLAYAENARAKSLTKKLTKAAYVTDVDLRALDDDANASDCSLIIHGHTHRPGISTTPAGNTRVVLPDWHFTGEKPLRGGWVRLENGHPILTPFASSDI